MPSAQTTRVIPRLDIKGPNVVKGVRLEGLRVVGDPQELAARYYAAGADELLYMDIVASLYGRNSVLEIIERAARSIFVPLTVGGGLRTLEDIGKALRAGADKVAVNTAAIKNPSFVAEAARKFGSQCIVVSIEAKRQAPGHWEALTDNGRERTGVDALTWAHKAAELGAGEILLTSVDQEGTRKGYDMALIARLARSLPVPVIACGGAGSPEDAAAVASDGGADAVSLAAILHGGRNTIAQVKDALAQRGVAVRGVVPAPA